MEFHHTRAGTMLRSGKGSTLITDHAELYKSLSPQDLEDLRAYFLRPDLDVSSFGDASWDMRKGYFDVIDGAGKKHGFNDLDYARRTVFGENLVGMAGGLPHDAKDPDEERIRKELDEKNSKGASGWLRRHKKGVALGIGGLVLLGGGIGVAKIIKQKYDADFENAVKELSMLNPSPEPTQEPDAEYDGIKIYGPDVLQEMIPLAMEKLKEKSPKDYNFLKENIKTVKELPWKSLTAGGAARIGDKINKQVDINADILVNESKRQGKEYAINGLIDTLCHEAEHVNGGGEPEAYAKGAECANNVRK